MYSLSYWKWGYCIAIHENSRVHGTCYKIASPPSGNAETLLESDRSQRSPIVRPEHHAGVANGTAVFCCFLWRLLGGQLSRFLAKDGEEKSLSHLSSEKSWIMIMILVFSLNEGMNFIRIVLRQYKYPVLDRLDFMVHVTGRFWSHEKYYESLTKTLHERQPLGQLGPRFYFHLATKPTERTASKILGGCRELGGQDAGCWPTRVPWLHEDRFWCQNGQWVHSPGHCWLAPDSQWILATIGGWYPKGPGAMRMYESCDHRLADEGPHSLKPLLVADARTKTRVEVNTCIVCESENRTRKGWS